MRMAVLNAEGEAVAANHLMGGVQRPVVLIIDVLIQLEQGAARLGIQ